jgi:hypothetical protein
VWTDTSPNGANLNQLCLQPRNQRLGQHHHAVFVALAAAHNDRVAVEIHILDPQTQRFAQAQPTAVEQGRQQCLGTRHVGKQRLNLLHRQHHWNPLLL